MQIELFPSLSTLHIGENSLVTQEIGGRQHLYATNSSGNRIDINIPPGTNLLIDGEDVMGSIDSSIALGAAFASLPTGAEGAGYTCGLGTGFHDSASAISGGCGFDFANYAFVDSMPEMFQKASFNIGAASVVSGEGDDARHGDEGRGAHPVRGGRHAVGERRDALPRHVELTGRFRARGDRDHDVEREGQSDDQEGPGLDVHGRRKALSPPRRRSDGQGGSSR